MDKRLIDADKLIHTIRNDIPIKVFGSMKNMGNVVEIVENAPTVDAVEVVRCKDCIHFHEDGYCLMGYCGNEDWFCAAGKRKEE